jgi:hypothetical protein
MPHPGQQLVILWQQGFKTSYNLLKTDSFKWPNKVYELWGHAMLNLFSSEIQYSLFLGQILRMIIFRYPTVVHESSFCANVASKRAIIHWKRTVRSGRTSCTNIADYRWCGHF